MSINIGLPQLDGLKPKIAVIGVGGAGGNAIANMIAAQVEGVEFLVANTDAQALGASKAERRIQLGAQITQGLGAGSRPEVGRAAAEESIVDLEQALEGMHMVFIAAGMGGGTGTGAAPVIAKAARDKGILTVGVVTKPFSFEGSRRMRSAESGIEELQTHVDTLIVIPNQNLFMIAEAKTTFIEAFRMADEVLQQGVRGITDLMVMPGLVNLDFADVKSVMRDAGKAMMGTGEAEGEGRALAAAQQAIANPLLDGVSMNGAKGVIISISGGEDLGLFELQEAGDHIRDLVDPDANIIWGSAFNPALNGKIRVSVVATGLDDAQAGGVQRQSFAFQPRRDSVAPAAPTYAAPAAPVGLAASAPSIGLGLGGVSAGGGLDSLSVQAPEEAAEPAPSFSPASQPAATPSFEMEVEETDDQPDDETAAALPPLDLDMDDADEGDELVLEAPSAPTDAEPAPFSLEIAAPDPEPAPEPSVTRSREGLPPVSGNDGDKPAVATTLFERMKAFSRSDSSKDGAADGDDEGFPAIPRFLGRQNNQ